MELDSARALKTMMLNAHHAVVAMAAESNEAPPPRVAVGIAPSEAGDYKLAIRVRSRAAVEHPHVLRMIDAARGEVDVAVTKEIVAQQVIPAAAPKNVAIGMSIGHFKVTAGTLGFFARDGAGRLGVVSNNHVLANEDDAQDGDAILQPGAFDGGTAADVFAKLVAPFPRIQTGRSTVDCAFALLESNAVPDLADVAGGILTSTVVEPRKKLHVQKVGRTTHGTSGKVRAFEVDGISVTYRFGTAIFDQQIEVEGDGADPFSSGGDSGSIVFDDDFNPVGLLFAGEVDGSLTYVNPITSVLTALGVALAV